MKEAEWLCIPSDLTSLCASTVSGQEKQPKIALKGSQLRSWVPLRFPSLELLLGHYQNSRCCWWSDGLPSLRFISLNDLKFPFHFSPFYFCFRTLDIPPRRLLWTGNWTKLVCRTSAICRHTVDDLLDVVVLFFCSRALLLAPFFPLPSQSFSLCLSRSLSLF